MPDAHPRGSVDAVRRDSLFVNNRKVQSLTHPITFLLASRLWSNLVRKAGAASADQTEAGNRIECLIDSPGFRAISQAA